MAGLTIRKLPDDVKQSLRERAARNGRSLEEGARRALIALVRPDQTEPRKARHAIWATWQGPGSI